MSDLRLFMILLGCKPAGRNTEQHDLFFGIGRSINDNRQSVVDFWKEAEGRLHIDGWREVRFVDGYLIEVLEKTETERTEATAPQPEKLFFINLGGYKENEFEEFHYKMLTVSADKGQAIQKARQTAFYKHTGFDGAPSHIDDKYGIDVDDVYDIEEILPAHLKEKYRIRISAAAGQGEDRLHLGYLKIDKL